MTPEKRLEACSSAQDLFALRADLEAALASEQGVFEKAIIHVRLGHLLKSQFLDGVAALRHFQDAFKLDPERLDAVGAARSVYRELGRLPLVQKLLGIEISAAASLTAAGSLYRELGDVLVDQGQAESAAEAYAEALKAGEDVGAQLEDVQLDESSYRARVDLLIEQSAGTDIDRLLRAAAVAARFEPDHALGILLRAYRLDPQNERAASLLEGRYIESERSSELLALQEDIVREASETATIAFAFGARWAERHLSEAALPFLERVLREEPSRTPAIVFIYGLSRTEPEVRELLLEIANAISENRGPEPALSYLLATAGLVASRDVNDHREAKKFFDRLAAVEPTHRALVEFREQVAAATATH